MILETGSTPATRKTTAKQLGEVQKFHPHELTNLLARVNTLANKFSNDSVAVYFAVCSEKYKSSWKFEI